MVEELRSITTRFPLKTIVRYPKGDPRRNVLSFLRKVLNIDAVRFSMQRVKADLIHYPFPLMYPRNIGKPSVLTFYDLQHVSFPDFFTPRKWRQRDCDYRKSVAAAERIIAISRHTGECLMECYGVAESKIDVVPLGIDDSFMVISDEQLLESAKTRFGFERPFLYYPAATWPHKNHLTLLSAVSVLQERYGFDGDLVLTGVTKQHHEKIYSEIQRLGLQKRVRLMGYLPYGDLPLVYNLARLMVFPSLFEGFGIPLLEAMACGCPVACSNTTSLPEVAGDAAVQFDPLSPEDMAAAIWSVWSDESLRQDLKQRGVERAARFTWEETARRTVGTYRKVLES
jgi:glycosyltransferase involved in cell wall biosynthesis